MERKVRSEERWRKRNEESEVMEKRGRKEEVGD